MKRTLVDQNGREVTLDDGVLDGHRADLGAAPPVRPVREVYAAAHVVMRDDYVVVEVTDDVERWIDWEVTAALRRRLDALGFGVAEAMDTAQRFSIGWPAARRLIEMTGALGLESGFIAGAGVDHRPEASSPEDLASAVVEQVEVIRNAGGAAMILPLLPLAAADADEETYVATYRAIIERVEGPVYVHWLGPMFLPALRGYFPGESFRRIMAIDPSTVRGCKLSLLDADLERRVRAELTPRGQIVLTGDDLSFAELILEGSHALLGIFDAIATPAGLALRYLAHGSRERYRVVMEPCTALARWVFRAPTERYKTGLAFLAWLNGHQSNRMLVHHEERGRSLDDLVRTAELASRAGVIEDADCAATRLRELVRMYAE